MTTSQSAGTRPDRLPDAPLPDLPYVGGLDAGEASTTYSHYRTGLSHHRTGLSEHRTDLSEYRTDLSDRRTGMSMRRTGLSIDRTRMSAERTLMSFIRTALSLISFGFTIHQAFQKLVEARVMEASTAPRNFGMALILIGVLLLAGGIYRHVQFALGLRRLQAESSEHGLAEKSPYPFSITLAAAVALMLVGVAAFIGIVL